MFNNSHSINRKMIAGFVSVLFALLPVSAQAQVESVQGPPAKLAGSESASAQKTTVDSGAAKANLPSLEDHKAAVFNVTGEVKVLKRNAEDWVAGTKDMILEVGDQILTGKGASIEFAYDEYFLNIARIEENTKAEFRSIEPTDLHLEDGAIFNALDGLNGTKYQISTPTAVAGVRGTHLFAEVANGESIFAVVPDQQGHISFADITTLENNLVSTIQEGQQIDLGGGAPQIENVKPEVLAFTQPFVQHFESTYGEFRHQGSDALGIAWGGPTMPAPGINHDGDNNYAPGGNPPNGGNGPGGFGGPNSGGPNDFMGRTYGDSLVDSSLDQGADPYAGQPGGGAAMNPWAMNHSVMQFMSLGGNYDPATNAGGTPTPGMPAGAYDPAAFSAAATHLYQGAGYSPDQASQMGNQMGNQMGGWYAPAGFDPANPGTAGMMGGYAPPGGMGGYDPANPGTAGMMGGYAPPGGMGGYDPAMAGMMAGGYAPDPGMYGGYTPDPSMYTFTPDPSMWVPPPDSYYNPAETAYTYTYTPPPTTTGTCYDSNGYAYPC